MMFLMRREFFVKVICQASVFSWGISLYFLHKYKVLEAIPTYVFVVVFIVFSLLAIYFGWGISREKSFYFGLVPFLSSISFIGLVEISRRLSWFQNKVLCKIGELSFSMYLVHYFFATSVFSYINSHLFQNLFSPELCLILYFGSTVFVSFWISKISYKLIEKPSVNIGRNIITKLNSLNYSPKAELR